MIFFLCPNKNKEMNSLFENIDLCELVLNQLISSEKPTRMGPESAGHASITTFRSINKTCKNAAIHSEKKNFCFQCNNIFSPFAIRNIMAHDMLTRMRVKNIAHVENITVSRKKVVIGYEQAGVSLESLIKMKKDTFGEVFVLQIIRQVSRALSFIHENNFIYSTIDPSTILVQFDLKDVTFVQISILNLTKSVSRNIVATISPNSDVAELGKLALRLLVGTLSEETLSMMCGLTKPAFYDEIAKTKSVSPELSDLLREMIHHDVFFHPPHSDEVHMISTSILNHNWRFAYQTEVRIAKIKATPEFSLSTNPFLRPENKIFSVDIPNNENLTKYTIVRCLELYTSMTFMYSHGIFHKTNDLVNNFLHRVSKPIEELYAFRKFAMLAPGRFTRLALDHLIVSCLYVVDLFTGGIASISDVKHTGFYCKKIQFAIGINPEIINNLVPVVINTIESKILYTPNLFSFTISCVKTIVSINIKRIIMQIVLLISPFAPTLLSENATIQAEIRRVCKYIEKGIICYAPTLKTTLERAIVEKKFLHRLKAENILSSKSATVFHQTVSPLETIPVGEFEVCPARWFLSQLS